ncbi:PREDICTED: universal stress protein PHOS34-like isoform X2 [Tarenaya hassleriana]|uniref:universal stress protein PHOS34-like isoform X2 n=1 Tax=Tarenaya hassleriana TaxID=28532 RepID=UPI00053C9A1F|nr:PREDICTED: universal stress protein PHOS34-like isoform X2 [Tarenaya hassleriana]
MATASIEEKPVMIVGVDQSDHSMYALEWTLDQFFASYASNPPFRLCVVHAKPSPTSAVCLAGPEVLPYVETDLKMIAAGVIQRAKQICLSKSVTDAKFEVVEGDPRLVMCDAVDKHVASVLVVGSHGYGAIKRAVLGSVSDYCSHHAHCTVMIVKKPKTKG